MVISLIAQHVHKEKLLVLCGISPAVGQVSIPAIIGGYGKLPFWLSASALKPFPKSGFLWQKATQFRFYCMSS